MSKTRDCKSCAYYRIIKKSQSLTGKTTTWCDKFAKPVDKSLGECKLKNGWASKEMLEEKFWKMVNSYKES